MTFSKAFQSIDKKIGYTFLKAKLQLAVFEPNVSAELSSAVTRLIRKDTLLLVPTRYRLSKVS